MTHNEFIEKIALAAISNYKKYRILPSLTIAMAIKESNWGLSKLASNDFNFFGMKWTSTCGCDYAEYNTKEWDKDHYKTIKAKFRKYADFNEGIIGFYSFITGYKRYANLIDETDAYKACTLIQKDGWATAPNYGDSLYNDYILKYNLMDYDKAALGIASLPTKDENVYIVKPGDTLWSISRNLLGFGSNWKQIFNYNKLTSTLIVPGQKLKIPKGGN